jgi:hypothetical protein
MWARELCDHLGVYIELGVPNEEEVLIENEIAKRFEDIMVFPATVRLEETVAWTP